MGEPFWGLCAPRPIGGGFRPNFLGRFNYLLNEMGIAIVEPNVRGSTGYGKTLSMLDNGLLRQDSYKDIAAA